MKLFVFLQVTFISSCWINILLVSAVEDGSGSTEVERQLTIENDNILRDYLGYYVEFIPEQLENWCPTNCNNGSQIFVHPHFSAYCSCIEKKDGWRTEKYYCAKNEIFNQTTSGCHEIPGKGYPTCVMKGRNCPNNYIGIRKHPDKNLFKNYIICSRNLVIVGECAEMYRYDDSKKYCAMLTINQTDLVVSDCPTVKDIECEKPGIFPVISAKEASIVCKNCFYICGTKNENTFELKVSCGKNENYYQIQDTAANKLNPVTQNIQIEQTSYPVENFTGNLDHTETIQVYPYQTESRTTLKLDETRITETTADYSDDESEPPEDGQSEKTTNNREKHTRYPKDETQIQGYMIGETTKHLVDVTEVYENSSSGRKTDIDETPGNNSGDDINSGQPGNSGNTASNGGTPIKQPMWYFWIIYWWILYNLSRR